MITFTIFLLHVQFNNYTEILVGVLFCHHQECYIWKHCLPKHKFAIFCRHNSKFSYIAKINFSSSHLHFFCLCIITLLCLFGKVRIFGDSGQRKWAGRNSFDKLCTSELSYVTERIHETTKLQVAREYMDNRGEVSGDMQKRTVNGRSSHRQSEMCSDVWFQWIWEFQHCLQCYWLYWWDDQLSKQNKSYPF